MPFNQLTGMSTDTYGKFKSESFLLFGGINAKASAYLNGPHEFRDLQNLNFLFPGALNKRPGSTMYVGSTLTGSILGGVEFQRLNGNSMIVISANTNLYTVTPPSTINTNVTGLLNGAIFNFVTFVDRLFCCNGQNNFKFDGTNNYNYSLPPGFTANWGVTTAAGGSLVGTGTTQVFFCAYGYVNERGYLGPVSNGFTIVVDGSTTVNSIKYYGMTQPDGYGITALQLWRTSQTGVDLYGTTQVLSGSTQATDTGFPLGGSLAIPHLWFTMVPRFQAIYNNQYFMAGFSSMPSRVYWSEIGEPEAVQPTFYAEFRTNDGDRITGMKVYNGTLVVAKQRSIHRLVGDNPSNFSIQEISTEYGCLSQQSMVVFENILWMLDQKGIAEYDGANISIFSEKVEPSFLAMNVPAALDKAVGAHYKTYNEVWFSVPLNGATLNNTILVYDYLSQAWTKYSGIQACNLFVAQGTQKVKTLFYGGYTGALFYVGASFFGDNGNPITCSAFTRWLAPSGQTTENMYRRFWLDIDPVLGITQSINFNLYTNYSTAAIQLTGSIQQSVYQTRTDFGLSARSIAAELFHTSATLPFKLNAYTFESRYQRSV